MTYGWNNQELLKEDLKTINKALTKKIIKDSIKFNRAKFLYDGKCIRIDETIQLPDNPLVPYNSTYIKETYLKHYLTEEELRLPLEKKVRPHGYLRFMTNLCITEAIKEFVKNPCDQFIEFDSRYATTIPIFMYSVYNPERTN